MTGLFPGFLTLSAAMFAFGALGVMVRRNPLVVFMSIELMLNAGNLALITGVYRSGRRLDIDDLSEMRE